MGVNNLWRLLLPVGRRVNVESLERKVCVRPSPRRGGSRRHHSPIMHPTQVNQSSIEQTLAIDVSIWLTQFIKAMRDDEGKVVKNAHLIGTFRRIVKVRLFGSIRDPDSGRRQGPSHGQHTPTRNGPPFHAYARSSSSTASAPCLSSTAAPRP